MPGFIDVDGAEGERLLGRMQAVSGIRVKSPVRVFTDTTAYTKIYRGHVIRLGIREFVVRGDVYEPRFGMKDQPKFWVKKAFDLESGETKIIKLKFLEAFVAKIGEMKVPCFRSPEKEGAVLLLVKGDDRFMQGETIFDEAGNHVRVIDFIPGNTLYGEIYEMDIDHEEYYYTQLRAILERLLPCFEAIFMLHRHDLCHGDIRNDHIIIEGGTGKFRWIDFDLWQEGKGFEVVDVWGLGNILQYVIGKGLNPFYDIRRSGRFSADAVSSLTLEDAGVFLNYRLMNLKKLYPYISDRLNDILLHFSIGAQVNYNSVWPLLEDLNEAIGDLSSSG